MLLVLTHGPQGEVWRLDLGAEDCGPAPGCWGRSAQAKYIVDVMDAGFPPDGSALVKESGDGQVFLVYLHVEVPSGPSIVSPPVESSLRKASLMPLPWMTSTQTSLMFSPESMLEPKQCLVLQEMDLHAIADHLLQNRWGDDMENGD